jgi:hypothetical protein
MGSGRLAARRLSFVALHDRLRSVASENSQQARNTGGFVAFAGDWLWLVSSAMGIGGVIDGCNADGVGGEVVDQAGSRPFALSYASPTVLPPTDRPMNDTTY